MRHSQTSLICSHCARVARVARLRPRAAESSLHRFSLRFASDLTFVLSYNGNKKRPALMPHADLRRRITGERNDPTEESSFAPRSYRENKGVDIVNIVPWIPPLSRYIESITCITAMLIRTRDRLDVEPVSLIVSDWFVNRLLLQSIRCKLLFATSAVNYLFTPLIIKTESLFLKFFGVELFEDTLNVRDCFAAQ